MAYIGSSPVLAQGDAGNGIASTSYNSSTGVVTITFDDETTTDTGDLRGTNGTNGTNGDTGATGATGDTGATGNTGATGADGEIDRTEDGSWSGSQRGTPLPVTDGTLGLDDANNFKYTPSADDNLEFDDESTSTGQAGFITVINPNGYVISLVGAIVKGASWDVSTPGTYLVSYYCDGTSVYVSASEALA